MCFNQNEPDTPKDPLGLMLQNVSEMRKNPSIPTDQIIAFIKEQIHNIENPHRAMELELTKLVESKTPPNGELYKIRADRSELAVAFFHRVYGRFYEAQIIYSHQLRTMDLELYTRLANLKTLERPLLPSKAEFNERLMRESNVDPELFPRLTRAFYRNRNPD